MVRNIHITPKGESWQVIGDNEKEGKLFDTQKEAIEFGKIRAKQEKCELAIHDKQGRIRQKDSYGNDPRGTKG